MNVFLCRVRGRLGVRGRLALCLGLSLLLLPRRAAAVLISPGYELDRFAGRYALGKNLPAVDRKTGFSFNRVDTGEVREIVTVVKGETVPNPDYAAWKAAWDAVAADLNG